jgi:hypothetical protein
MTQNPKVAVTAITVTTPEGENYVLLGAQDPRWRLDGEGKYQGKAALDAQGAPVPLPLQPGFIGGEIDITDFSASCAALREIGEEAGETLKCWIQKSRSLKAIYTASSAAGTQPTTIYYHAHLDLTKLGISFDDFKNGLKAGDDSVATMLVKPEQITYQEGHGYVINGAPEFTVWRPYEPVKSKGAVTAEKQKVIDVYNAQGKEKPLIGIDTECLKKSPAMFSPPGVDATTKLNSKATHGDHVSNGAIFEAMVKPRIAQPQTSVSAKAAAAVR